MGLGGGALGAWVMYLMLTKFDQHCWRGHVLGRSQYIGIDNLELFCGMQIK